MAVVIRLPSVAAGAAEATIAHWLVSVGDVVSAGTPLAEIETEKAMVEYAAEDAGTVGRLVVAAGETDADIDAALGEAAPGNAVPESPAPAAISATSAASVSEGNGHRPAPSRVFASPIARKAARERGIDLASVTGTGPNGRIVRRDIERVPARPAPAPWRPAAGETAAGETLIPHTAMRRAIARRLTESKATVPHFYLAAECVVDELLELRERINETSAAKISVNDFVIAAAAAAFGDVPEANVTWSGDGLVARENVDIAIAVATDGGLLTPVLRDAGSRKLSDIARMARDLAERARDRRLKQHELEGGVFCVSNLGMYGTLEFSAIINPPQSGILAVGAARQQPVARDGAVSVATVMRCTLSADHRAIDGALAARWLAAFTRRIEHPLGTIA